MQAQPDVQKCEQMLKSYQGWKETPNTQWTLRLQSPSGGSLVYLGADHSTEPAHLQFAQIQQQWQTQKPTLVFFEGPNRGVAASAQETIQQFGESGYVRFLAQADGIKAQSLEPSPQEEVSFLLNNSKFSKEQIKLFFVLREASRLRERKGLNEAEVKKAIEQLLPKVNSLLTGFEEVIPDIAALQTAYQKYWNSPANWWEAPVTWFSPAGDGKKTGGKFTHEINRLSSEYRDLHMYRILTKAVLAGEKVLAVVGRNHVPMQAEALTCAIAK